MIYSEGKSMASKEVKKKGKKDFYLYLYNFIKDKGVLPTNEFSKQRLNYYVRRLKKADLIRKKGYGVWEITGNFEELKKYKQVKKVNDDAMRTRGHGFVFKVLLKEILGWDNLEQYFKENFLPFKKIKQGLSITLRGHTIWLCSSSVIIYFSPKLSFFSRDSYSASGNALIECKETIRALERELKVSLKYGKGWFIREVKSHYADIRNCLADYYQRKGINRFEIEQGGKAWAMVDNSFNLLELETIAGNGDSKNDLPKLQMFLNDLRDNPTTLTILKDKAENDLKSVYGIINQQNEVIAKLEGQIIRLTEMIRNGLL